MRLNDKNTLDINGQAATVAPFDYQAQPERQSADLARFEPLLLASRRKQQQSTRAEIEAASSAKTPPAAQINAPGKTASRDNVSCPPR